MASTPYATTVGCAQYPDLIPITIPVFAASAIANGDELVAYTPGFNFEVVKIDFVTVTPITTGGKTATFVPKIGSTAIAGGTSTALAGAQAKGVAVTVWLQNQSPQALHIYGKPTDTVGLTASAVTAFTEGAGYFLMQIRNVGNLA